jgi:hypothetical protein
MEQLMRNPILDHLDAVVGEWKVEATHPYFANTIIRGRATFEWLEGRHFLIWRAQYDHPDIPDSIAILGGGDQHEGGASSDSDGKSAMHYFDSRGVSRVYLIDAEHGVWRFWRDAPAFNQRYVCTISADGATMVGNGELSRDGSTWEQDLHTTYERVRSIK